MLVQLGIIAYFIPYLFLFASMFRLQSEQASADVIRVPGGKFVALLISIVGFATTSLTICLSFVPSADEPNKLLAIVKVVGLTAVLLGVGWGIYWLGTNRRRSAAISA